jgi:hypothetical protein
MAVCGETNISGYKKHQNTYREFAAETTRHREK